MNPSPVGPVHNWCRNGRLSLMRSENPPIASPIEQDRLELLFGGSLFHSGSADRHSRNRQARSVRLLAQQPRNVFCGNVAFERVSPDPRGVAGAKIVRHSEAGRFSRSVAVLNLDVMPGLPKVLDPLNAAAAGR